MFQSSLIRLSILAIGILAVLGSGQSTCSPNSPCAQGCCSKSGYCGFGPAFCGQGNCTSGCDAQAECGQYAPMGSFDCPLNVCCSQYGYCGTTSDFCGNGCQTGCQKVTEPSCGGASAEQISIGYYESWSYDRKCDAWTPEDIDAGAWTHLNYAFALIGSDFKIAQMNTFDAELYPRVTSLKAQNSGLQVFISIGGWAAGGKIFSDMVSSASARQTFIASLQTFLVTYGFDGVDIDWEYPAAEDRGGVPADTANFVTLLQELRAALGTRYGITATLPSSYWYLQGLDVVNMEKHLDWFNFMSYDIHGTWDGNSPYTQAIVQPHTNLTEITTGLDLLWRNNISPSKVVLGLGFYGRSFTLSTSACKTPGCPFSGGGNPGDCTATSGILSNAEIDRIIQSNGLNPVLDQTAAIKYMTWDTNQWVSYDDDETIAMKKTYANNHCLRGTMVWALDLADPNKSTSVENLIVQGMAGADGVQALSNKAGALSKYRAISQQNQINLQVFWTQCAANPTCPPGFKQLTLGHGKVFDADRGTVTGDGCHGGGNGYNRALCVEADVQTRGCSWFGKAKGCSQTCPQNMILIAQNSHIGGEKASCKSGHFASFCCAAIESSNLGFCPAKLFEQQLGGGQIPRISNKGLYNYGYGTETECESIEIDAPSPYDSGLYLVNNVPGIWQRGGVGEFKAQHNKPYPVFTIQPECKTTIVVDIPTTTTGPITTSTCDYNHYGQACEHYSSVIRTAANNAAVLTCPMVPGGPNRPIVNEYDRQHKLAWNQWVSARPRPAGGVIGRFLEGCDRDEYPPIYFSGGGSNFIQWVRRVPAQQNRGAGNLWAGVCNIETSSGPKQGGPINGQVCTEYVSVTYTLPRYSMAFRNMPNDAQDGIGTNWCQLVASMTDDAGFALMTDDGWYRAYNQGANSAMYWNQVIPAALTTGLTPPRAANNFAKRWLNEFPLDIEDFTVDDGNSSRYKSDQEMFDSLGLEKCESPDCKDKIGIAQFDSQEHAPTPAVFSGSAPLPALAPTTEASSPTATYALSAGGSPVPAGSSPQSPTETAARHRHNTHRHLRAHYHGRAH